MQRGRKWERSKTSRPQIEATGSHIFHAPRTPARYPCACGELRVCLNVHTLTPPEVSVTAPLLDEERTVTYQYVLCPCSRNPDALKSDVTLGIEA